MAKMMKGTQTRRGLAIVTGASSGLGESFARQLARRGHDVLLVARRQQQLELLKYELEQTGHRNVRTVVADLATSDGRALLWEAVDQGAQVPQLLVNNAGVGSFGDCADLSGSSAQAMLAINVEALTLLSMEAAKRMVAQRSGAIMNVASTAAFTPLPKMAVYGATKAFVLSFSDALREELRAHNVRVFVVAPGGTATEFHDRAGLGKPPQSLLANSDECVRRSLVAFEAQHDEYIDGMLNRAMVESTRWIPRTVVARLSAKMMRASAK